MCVCVCVCVRARGLCDGEAADARWANPGLRVYCCFCFCSCPDLGLGFVSVLSRFCLGVVSPHLPQTPYHPTGGVIGIYMVLRMSMQDSYSSRGLLSGRVSVYIRTTITITTAAATTTKPIKIQVRERGPEYIRKAKQASQPSKPSKQAKQAKQASKASKQSKQAKLESVALSRAS